MASLAFCSRCILAVVVCQLFLPSNYHVQAAIPLFGTTTPAVSIYVYETDRREIYPIDVSDTDGHPLTCAYVSSTPVTSDFEVDTADAITYGVYLVASPTSLSASTSYDVTVICDDGSLNATAVLTVTILPNTAPSVAALVNQDVDETETGSRKLESISYTDPDTARGQNVSCLLLTSVPVGPFNVTDSDNGVYFTAATTLNYAIAASYVLTVECTDSWGDSTTVDMTVTVIDNLPPAIVPPTPVSVAEFEDDPRVLLTLAVTEPESENFSCTLLSSNPTTSDFTVSTPDSLAWKVGLQADPVDLTTNGQFNLTIECTDQNGYSSTTELVVDVTPNQFPVITPLTDVDINEGQLQPTKLGAFTASDADVMHNVTCLLASLIPSGPTMSATWNDTSAEYELYFTAETRLNYLTASSHNLTVACNDSFGDTSYASMIVTVIDNLPPIIDPVSTVTVSECERKVRTLVNLTVTEPESETFICELIGTTPPSSDFMVLSYDSLTYSVILKENPVSLDTSSQFFLEVMCEDNPGENSIIILTVNVTRNTPPVIAPFADVYVNETLTTPRKLASVIVTDPDTGQTPSCNLVDSSVPFTVKWDTTVPEYGVYYTAKTRLSFTVQNYTLTVKCTDSCGNYSTADIVVRVNENLPPVITYLPGNATIVMGEKYPRTIYFLTVTDPESSFVHCVINKTDPPVAPFDMRCSYAAVSECKVKLRVSPPIIGTQYVVTVECIQENGSPSYVNLTVDVVPNEPPTFDNIYAGSSSSVHAKNTKKGGAVFDVDATDTENDWLTYSMTCAPDTGSFEMDSVTGKIKAARDLSYETVSVHTCSVTVSDGTTNVTESHKITLTNLNRPPVISNLDDSVDRSEFHPSGSQIYQLVVSDPDGHDVIYDWKVTPSLYRAMFDVNQGTGEIILVLGELFNYERRNNFRFEFFVSDAWLKSGPYYLDLFIEDENEVCFFDQDKYYISGYEGVIGSYSIISGISVSDPDGDDTWISKQVTTYSDHYDIGDGSIVTYLKDIDREAIGDTVTLMVECTDRNDGSGLIGTATVVVSILDVNDNDPMYRSDCEVYFNQYTKPGATIGWVNTTDIDKDKNAELKYLATTSQHSPHVTIAENGAVLMGTIPEYPFGTSFTFDVTVQDSGDPQRANSYSCDVYYVQAASTTSTSTAINPVTQAPGWFEDTWHVVLVAVLAGLIVVFVALGAVCCIWRYRKPRHYRMNKRNRRRSWSSERSV